MRKDLLRGRAKPKKIVCLHCDGTKIDPDKPDQQCKECNGTGEMSCG